MTRLTIAIPNFNGGEKLKKAIISCKLIKIPQDEFDILVVDNKSTDNSLEIVDELKKEFPNLRLIKNQDNVGRIQNWNACIKNCNSKYITFLFINDLISKHNNIDQILEILDSDDSISLSLSPVIKKENTTEYVKRKYFDNPVKCSSKKISEYSLKRGLFPFGFIESNIYRVEDIKNAKNYFLDDFPFNADEIFSYSQVVMREYVLFNHQPQIEWLIVEDRTFRKMRLEDEIQEYYKTIEVIERNMHLDIDYGLVSTYRLFNFIKYFSKNFRRQGQRNRIFFYILSQMKKKNSFFAVDSLLFKIIFKKLKETDKEMEDLLFKEIITKCVEETIIKN
jgi:glycosyltransferase involved in cell wall biosynthesis